MRLKVSYVGYQQTDWWDFKHLPREGETVRIVWASDCWAECKVRQVLHEAGTLGGDPKREVQPVTRLVLKVAKSDGVHWS